MALAHSLARTSFLVVALGFLAGCAATLADPPAEPPADPPVDRIRLRPLPNLNRVEVPIPGVLELLRDHKIGGYDALLIRDSRLDYRDGSMRLTRAAESAFLSLLSGSLVSATEAAEVPMRNAPDRCVMEIEMDVDALDLETGVHSPDLAELVVTMLFRDSLTGKPLLRYSKRDRIAHPSSGVTNDQQLRVGLRRIVDEMNVATVLRPAGLATDDLIEGCQGVLGARGRQQTTGL